MYRGVMTGRSRPRVRFVSPTQKPRDWRRRWRSNFSAGLVFASRPLHFRRHRRQDGIYVAAGFQAEHGAAVVEQIELDITAATDQLLFAFSRSPVRIEIPANQFGINFRKGAADFLGEAEVGIPVAGIMMIVENAPDSTGFLAMRQIEIFVAPGFV